MYENFIHIVLFMSIINMDVVFLHCGPTHQKSRHLCERFLNKKLSITPIEIGSHEILDLVKYNSKNITIDKLPCFLVHHSNGYISVHHWKDYEIIEEFCSGLEPCASRKSLERNIFLDT